MKTNNCMRNLLRQNFIKAFMLLAVTNAVFVGGVSFASADTATTSSTGIQQISQTLATTTTTTYTGQRQISSVVCTGSGPRVTVNGGLNSPTGINNFFQFATSTCTYSYTFATTTEISFSTTTTATSTNFFVGSSTEIYPAPQINFPENSTTTFISQNDQLLNFTLLLAIFIAVLMMTIIVLKPLYVRK